MSHAFLERTLFSRNTSEPKSYVVGFKYEGDISSTVITGATISTDVQVNFKDFFFKLFFFQLNLALNFQHSWGHAEFNNGIDIYDNHYAIADIHVPSTKNFSVDVNLYGNMGIGSAIYGMSSFLRLKIFRPRSSALLGACNQHHPKTAFRQFAYGQRADDDSLLQFRKDSVGANDDKLPRYNVYFEDTNAKLTSVMVRLNVSLNFCTKIWILAVKL